MRIQSIAITNMAKFENFRTELPAVTLIQGKNGDGKTSLLDCLRYSFGRGYSEDILRAGAENGEILIKFDDGGELKCTTSRKNSTTTRSYKAPGTRRFVVSREMIDGIANAISYDPLAFMSKPDKEQLEIILKIMPVTADPAELELAVGDAGPEAEPVIEKITPDMNGFRVVELIHGQIYEQRRVLNVAADTQEKHASQLREALAPEPEVEEDWTMQAEAMAAEKSGAESALKDGIRKLNDEFLQFRSDVQLDASEQEKEINAEIAAKILALEEERNRRMSEVQKSGEKLVELKRTECAERAAKLRSEQEPIIAQYTTALATATERARQQQQTKGTKGAIDVATQEAQAHRDRSVVLTQALERLQELKRSIAARLPIPGITIEDGRIFNTEKIPFSRWNTEKQMRFCLRIAVLAHGTAGFICLDGAERFDKQHRDSLVKTAKKYAEEDGLQFLIATVSDEEFSVREG